MVSEHSPHRTMRAMFQSDTVLAWIFLNRELYCVLRIYFFLEKALCKFFILFVTFHDVLKISNLLSKIMILNGQLIIYI